MKCCMQQNILLGECSAMGERSFRWRMAKVVCSLNDINNTYNALFSLCLRLVSGFLYWNSHTKTISPVESSNGWDNRRAFNVNCSKFIWKDGCRNKKKELLMRNDINSSEIHLFNHELSLPFADNNLQTILTNC